MPFRHALVTSRLRVLLASAVLVSALLSGRPTVFAGQSAAAPPAKETAAAPPAKETEECRTAPNRLSGLRLMAMMAKCRGDASISFSLIDPDGEGRRPAFDALLRKSAVYLATPARIDADKEVTDSDIFTWQVLQVEQALATAVPAKGCHALPASLKLETGQIAVPMYGGTVTLEGVSVSMTGEMPATLREGQRYLVVGDACGRNVVLAGGPLGLWAVSADGALQPLPSQASSLTQSFRTVDAIRNYITRNRK